ncbi:MAG: InlB B-repeat-containing protein [Oscillospiraceae bacterium]|nr:InlB B-repeat-containing protein [Oscillospiraceae bacterium]
MTNTKTGIKKVFSALMALIIAVTILPLPLEVSASTIPSGFKPIYTADDLYNIRNDLASNYILMNDIDLSEVTAPGGDLDFGNGWEPINRIGGLSGQPIGFSGIFDGNGYQIKGMQIFGELDVQFSWGDSNFGLFGTTWQATIRNLAVVDFDINVSTKESLYDYDNLHSHRFGGIVGYGANSTVANCFASGRISVNSDYNSYVGGLAGYIQHINNSASDVVINLNASFTNLRLRHNIIYNNIGGIAGGAETIKNCISAGKITTSSVGNNVRVYRGAVVGRALTWSAFRQTHFDYTSNWSPYTPLINCYYLSGIIDSNTNSDNGSFLNENQMRRAISFLGFDFNDVWAIHPDFNNGFPVPKVLLKFYDLTVYNGTGGGSVLRHTTAEVTANPAPVGMQFKNWTASGVTLADADSVSTSFTMPEQAVSVTANYERLAATVSSLSVSPGTAEVQKGTAFQLSAAVAGANDPTQTVTWAVSGGIAGTTINNSGLLTVAADETAETLTVTATSALSANISNTAVITITDEPSAVEVTAVTVTPGTIYFNKGDTHTFSVAVAGTNSPQGVKWEVSGGVAGTTINNSGLLTIAANETASTLTVTATSTHTESIIGTATVMVIQPTITKTLVSITQPTAITGRPNATPKTIAGLNLPETVTMVTNDGNVQANVTWDVEASTYNTATTTAQTFPVNGTVTLPAGILNPNNVSLAVSVSVTVIAKSNSSGSGSSGSSGGGGGGGGGGSTAAGGVFTITFVSNYATYATLQTGADGKLTSLPANPTRSGFTFDGWYAITGGSQITTGTVFTANTNVQARWKEGGSTEIHSGISTIIVNMPITIINTININIPIHQMVISSAGTHTLNAGAAHAGQNAVLVKFNELTNSFEFVTGATIGTNGNANFNISQIGEFLSLIFKTGDVTGTGEVQTSDALALLRHVAGIAELDAIQLFVANGKEGDVGTTDALNILRLVAGVIEKI